MIRIYLDSNVYSNLRRNEKEQYQQLNQLLEKYRHNLSFFFSYAHIRDKKKDTSPIKFEDFSFMEKFTTDNYIAYHPLEKDTTFYLATPAMVFDDEQYGQNDITSLLNIFEPQADDDPIMGQAKRILKDQLTQTPWNVDVSIDESLPPEQQELLKKIMPSGKQSTLGDLMNHFMNYVVELNTNHDTYKKLRRMIDESINKGKITLKNDPDYNEALRDTAIQKTFTDFVKASVKPNPSGNYPLYEFYLQAYNSLDFLGISKDDITKKNNYANLFNDGLHSFYASFFDYLVTEDAGLTDKSKALYNMFGITTTVLSVNEFIERLPTIGSDTEEDLMELFGKLDSHRKNSPRVNEQETEDGVLSFMEAESLFLNTFDLIVEHKTNEEIDYFLYEDKKTYLAGSNFRETASIVNKCLALLGKDLYNKGEFSFEKEVAEIRNGTWEGRVWAIGTLLVQLHNNKGLGSLALLVRPVRLAAS